METAVNLMDEVFLSGKNLLLFYRANYFKKLTKFTKTELNSIPIVI